MRVLVTGGRSLLGRYAARALLARGDEVTVLQRSPSGLPCREVLGDLRDAVAVRSSVAGQDAVLHLAAKVDVHGPWADFVAVNVDGTRAVVDACRTSGVGRLVHVSSPSVAHTGTALVGAGAGPAQPDLARGSYARSKAMAELLALAADGPDLAVVAVRPHLVWGPGDTQLVGRLVARARTGRLPRVGAGTALVDSTCVDNAADALVAALDRCEAAHGQALVVTNGEPRPVGELVEDILCAAGAPPPRVSVPVPVAMAAGAAVDAVWSLRSRLAGRGIGAAVGEPPLTRFLVEQLSTAHWFDQRRTREALGWTPAVSLDEGLARLALSSRARPEVDATRVSAPGSPAGRRE